MLRYLIESPIKVQHFICSDINHDLINLWQVIKEAPDELMDGYFKLWSELNRDEDIERRKDFYTEVRTKFNKYHSDSAQFLFLMRTCFNGMPRYNRNGEFNTSLHFTRPGISPDKLEVIIRDWNKVLNDRHVDFFCCSYSEIEPSQGDFVYLDPPYANTDGMYSGGINLEEFYQWLRALPCSYALSFDGKVKNKDFTQNVPSDLFSEHHYISSGNSSFRRLKTPEKDAVVMESLYVQLK